MLIIYQLQGLILPHIVYRFHGKPIATDKRKHKNKNSNGRCGKKYILYLTSHYHLPLFNFLVNNANIGNTITIVFFDVFHHYKLPYLIPHPTLFLLSTFALVKATPFPLLLPIQLPPPPPIFIACDFTICSTCTSAHIYPSSFDIHYYYSHNFASDDTSIFAYLSNSNYSFVITTSFFYQHHHSLHLFFYFCMCLCF